MTTSVPGTPRLTVLSRDGCELCEELLQELAQLGTTVDLPPIEVRDVDADALLARRYGLDVPVLLLDGVKVCQHHLDPHELMRLLRPR
jgi:predicted thioredoxin/glutaredoxin